MNTLGYRTRHGRTGHDSTEQETESAPSQSQVAIWTAPNNPGVHPRMARQEKRVDGRAQSAPSQSQVAIWTAASNPRDHPRIAGQEKTVEGRVQSAPSQSQIAIWTAPSNPGVHPRIARHDKTLHGRAQRTPSQSQIAIWTAPNNPGVHLRIARREAKSGWTRRVDRRSFQDAPRNGRTNGGTRQGWTRLDNTEYEKQAADQGRVLDIIFSRQQRQPESQTNFRAPKLV